MGAASSRSNSALVCSSGTSAILEEAAEEAEGEPSQLGTRENLGISGVLGMGGMTGMRLVKVEPDVVGGRLGVPSRVAAISCERRRDMPLPERLHMQHLCSIPCAKKATMKL